MVDGGLAMGEGVGGKLPSWMILSARAFPAFMVIAVVAAGWRGVSIGTMDAERWPILLGFTLLINLVFAYFTLSGFHRVEASPAGLFVRRLSGARRAIAWNEIDTVTWKQGTGRKGLGVTTTSGSKIYISEIVSNFDALVEEILSRSGSELEANTKWLYEPDTKSRLVYAYQANQLTWDNLYLLHVGKRSLQFLRVGGQFDGSDSGPHSDDPAVYVNPELLARYVGLDLADPAAIAIDKKNFTLSTSTIRSVRLRSKRYVWMGHLPNSGSLLIEPVGDKPKRYVLIGTQDHGLVKELFKSAGVKVVEDSDPSR